MNMVCIAELLHGIYLPIFMISFFIASFYIPCASSLDQYKPTNPLEDPLHQTYDALTNTNLFETLHTRIQSFDCVKIIKGPHRTQIQQKRLNLYILWPFELNIQMHKKIKIQNKSNSQISRLLNL